MCSCVHLISADGCNQSMYHCAFTLAFYGCLRVRKFTAPSASRFDRFRTLLLTHCSLAENFLIIVLQRNKTEQHNLRAVVIHQSPEICCPIAAFTRYLGRRRHRFPPHDPLYIHADGSYLTRQLFSDAMKRVLPATVNATRFAPHSFRIGAATEEAAAGKSKRYGHLDVTLGCIQPLCSAMQ